MVTKFIFAVLDGASASEVTTLRCYTNVFIIIIIIIIIIILGTISTGKMTQTTVSKH